MPRVPYLIAKRGSTGGSAYNVKRPRRPDQTMSLPESPVMNGDSIRAYITGASGVLSTVGQVRQARIGNRPLHAAAGSQLHHDEVRAAAKVLIRGKY